MLLPELPVVFILGPTASGKTAAGIELYQNLRCQLISVDSSLVYRRMDIGTAKPTSSELQQAPHSLINIREPWQTYSAADFRTDALRLISEAHAAQRIPVLLGGTMLYFQALEYGLSRLPVADSDVRASISRQAAVAGWAALHTELAQVDPDSAQRIHPNDPQRIQRALEVYRVSGRTITQWHLENKSQSLPYRLIKFALAPEDRTALHRVIESRFAEMLTSGLLDEVSALSQEPQIHRDLPSMKAVGYRQAWDFLLGGRDQALLLSSGQAATRQLAKRQLTWMRGMADLRTFNPQKLSSSEISQLMLEEIGTLGQRPA